MLPGVGRIFVSDSPRRRRPFSYAGFNWYDQPPKVNMAALETDSGLRSKLAAIGLEPMADWVAHGCQNDAIPGWIIVACATMFTRYVEMVPQDVSKITSSKREQLKTI